MRSNRALLRSCVVVAALTGVAVACPSAQTQALEYQVKAAYLFNFVKFVDWPAGAGTGPFTICVAQPNPFGRALAETIRGESIDGRPIAERTIGEPDTSCQVIFIPRGASTSAYLGAARHASVLTVGETARFIGDGGIINFIIEGNTVHFEINQQAASRVGLAISSRLLRLARPADRNASAP